MERDGDGWCSSQSTSRSECPRVETKRSRCDFPSVDQFVYGWEEYRLAPRAVVFETASFASLFMLRPRINLVTRILRLEEVDQLEDVRCGGHPFCGIGDVVVLAEA